MANISEVITERGNTDTHTETAPHTLSLSVSRTHKAQCIVSVRCHVPGARWVLRAVKRAAAFT